MPLCRPEDASFRLLLLLLRLYQMDSLHFGSAFFNPKILLVEIREDIDLRYILLHHLLAQVPEVVPKHGPPGGLSLNPLKENLSDVLPGFHLEQHLLLRKRVYLSFGGSGVSAVGVAGVVEEDVFFTEDLPSGQLRELVKVIWVLKRGSLEGCT